LKLFIVLLCLVPVYSAISHAQGYMNISSFIKYFITVTFLFVSFSLFLKNRNSNYFKDIDKFLHYLFIVYTIILIFTSIRFETFYIQEFFVGDLFALPYLLPIFLLNIQLDPLSLNVYFNIGRRLLIIGLVMLIWVLVNLNQESWQIHILLIDVFLFSFPILFLVKSFLFNWKIQYLLYLIFFLFLFVTAFYGRRGVFADLVLIFVFTQLIDLTSKRLSKIFIVARYTLMILIIAPLILFYYSDVGKLYIFERQFSQKGWEDSRGLVVDEFFSDFKSSEDWIFGRGLNGLVKRSVGAATDIGKGNVIENGYLQIVLKGGNVYFFFVLYFFTKGFYLSWFKTKNDFTKGFGALFIIYFIGMIGLNQPIIGHRYFLIWLAVPICFSPFYRSLNNEQVKNMFVSR